MLFEGSNLLHWVYCLGSATESGNENIASNQDLGLQGCDWHLQVICLARRPATTHLISCALDQGTSTDTLSGWHGT